jgi:hypothetical protein
MVLHITKKLADKLKLSPAPATAADGLFSWRANYVQEHGQRFVVFMNDASRFIVVINGAKMAKLKRLPDLFIQTLRETLRSFGVDPEVIDRYIAEAGETAYAKNADRKKTAQLNKSADTAWWSLRDYDGDVDLSVCASSTKIFSTDESFTPKDKMLNLLGKYGLPVLKFHAYDLNVRLELGGRDAVRRLRVPASISFKRLHRVLQAAFGWTNHHLYNFGLLKEWSEDYFAQPDVELVLSEDDFEINPDARLMTGVKLSDYVPEYRKILYTYDYGDNWQHYIEVDNIIDGCSEDLPLLLSGEGDAPPEDVGGTGGFAEFLEVIADPGNEDYEHMTAWVKMQWWKPFDFEATARQVKGSPWY